MVTAIRKKKSKDASSPEEKLLKYEQLFEQLAHFTGLVTAQDDAIIKAKLEMQDAKEQFEKAKDHLQTLEQMRDGAKHNLYRFLSPKNGKFEFMPLFDKMDEADEQVHGRNSTAWRQEPIAALKLSLPSLQILADADIVLVGQLQDRVLAEPDDWWHKLPALSAGAAAAIVDRLNDFIWENSK